MYYVDLTLRDGVNLEQAIQTAKEIDQQSKASGFNQHALDQIARQGYGNAKFEVNSEEGLDLVEEFYNSDEQEQPPQTDTLHSDVATLQKGLAQSVRPVN